MHAMMGSIAKTFRVVSEALRSQNIPVVLIGGFALGAYGLARHTADADFIIAEESLEKVKLALTTCGYREAVRTSIFVRFTASEVSLLDLDFLLVSEATLSGVLDAVQTYQVGDSKAQVPSLEHLIALKLHAIKNDPKREMKDLFDVYELIKKNPDAGILNKLLDLCDKYGTDRLYHKLMELVKKS